MDEKHGGFLHCFDQDGCRQAEKRRIQPGGGLKSVAGEFEERDLDELWKHSMGCAVAAQIISDKSGGVDRKTVLTAAILHDIGKVIMDLFFSREYAKTLTTVRNNGLSMAKAEENIMGFNHADAGGWFCDEIAFPSVLVSPISFHHNVDGVDKEHELITSIVHIADNLCKRAQIGDGGDDNKNHAINLHAQRLLNLNKDDLEKITGEESIYKSPTDMGVNRASAGIMDDKVIQVASHQEIIRRYFRCAVEYAMGLMDKDSVERAELIMEKVNAKVEDRRVVKPSRDAAVKANEEGKGNEGIFCGAAIELKDGTIITGKNSPLMHAASSLILNATKHLANLPEDMHLLPKNSIDSLTFLKKEVLTGKMISLDTEETLIVLGISAISNPAAQLAVEKLKELRNCEVHLTHIPTPGDEAGLRKLHVNLTCDPEFSTKSLFLRD